MGSQAETGPPLINSRTDKIRGVQSIESYRISGIVAPFVMDKDKESFISKELWVRVRPLWKKFRRVLKRLKPLMQLMISQRFEVPVTMFWPAAAVFLWCQDIDWEELTDNVEADEGDLAMLILRTADHLRQITSLERENRLWRSQRGKLSG